MGAWQKEQESSVAAAANLINMGAQARWTGDTLSQQAQAQIRDAEGIPVTSAFQASRAAQGGHVFKVSAQGHVIPQQHQQGFAQTPVAARARDAHHLQVVQTPDASRRSIAKAKGGKNRWHMPGVLAPGFMGGGNGKIGQQQTATWHSPTSVGAVASAGNSLPYNVVKPVIRHSSSSSSGTGSPRRAPQAPPLAQSQLAVFDPALELVSLAQVAASCERSSAAAALGLVPSTVSLSSPPTAPTSPEKLPTPGAGIIPSAFSTPLGVSTSGESWKLDQVSGSTSTDPQALNPQQVWANWQQHQRDQRQLLQQQQQTGQQGLIAMQPETGFGATWKSVQVISAPPMPTTSDPLHKPTVSNTIGLEFPAAAQQAAAMEVATSHALQAVSTLRSVQEAN